MNNPNILIICQSMHHGNTMKVAKVIGEVLNAKVISPKDFDENSLSEYELIGFGSGIYNQKHHESLFNLVNQLDNQNNKEAFIFSTSTIPFKSVNKDLHQSLTEKNFDVIGEFSCKGFMDYSFAKKLFGGLNKGRPNSKDLKNAEEFAKKLEEDSHMEFFEYGQKEIEYLKRRDKKLGAAIDEIGMIKREITPEPFTALISSIISQQISKKAAETVGNRLLNRVGSITPENIIKVSLPEIQSCGMTVRKAEYIKGIANTAISGDIDFNTLHTLTDNEIIKKLSALNGVGIWTVEMLLIFSLCRPDVVSYGDLAIRRGMMKLYNVSELSKEKFDRYRKRYSPYGSVASLYLWALSIANTP